MCAVPCEVGIAAMGCKVERKIKSFFVAAKSSGNEEAIANEDIAATRSGSGEDH